MRASQLEVDASQSEFRPLCSPIKKQPGWSRHLLPGYSDGDQPITRLNVVEKTNGFW